MTLTLIWMIATCMVLVSMVRFVGSGIGLTRFWMRVEEQRINRVQKMRSDAEVARLQCSIKRSEPSDQALQWRVLEVAERVQESNDCVSFYLFDPSGRKLPEFRPGQYAMVRPALAGAFQTMRCYSISCPPNHHYYRLTVKNAASPRERLGRKEGGLSGWLHEDVASGDCLLVSRPAGSFFLSPQNDKPVVLLAAGVGITPMASMLAWSQIKTPDRQVRLLYQAKDRWHWPLGQEMLVACRDSKTSNMQTYFSRESVDQLGTYLNQQFLHEKQLDEAEINSLFRIGKYGASEIIKAAPSPETHFFMCGPDAWMKGIREQLSSRGVPSDQVHWESFGGDAPVANKTGNVGQNFQVKFEPSQTEAIWQDGEQSLWELAQEAGIVIPSGCMSGVCGSCKCRVRAGEIEHIRQPIANINQDECLTCIAHPLSDVQLEV